MLVVMMLVLCLVGFDIVCVVGMVSLFVCVVFVMVCVC